MTVENSGTLRLGSLTVYRLGFGSMQLTGSGVWGPPKDHDGALAVLRRGVELGVDLIDEADSYGPNVAEDGVAAGERLDTVVRGVQSGTR
jgi:pyridoxine 4-dehydrogenase